MSRSRKPPVTALSDNDRKVLSKYTKQYTNFIESSTADIPPQDDEKSRKGK